MTIRRQICAVALALVAISGRGVGSDVAAIGGVIQTRFTAPPGILHVSLPDGMRTGDRISGAIRLDPAGADDIQRNANLALMRSWHLAIGDSAAPLSAGIIKFKLPDFFIGTVIPLILTDAQGAVVGSHAIPIAAIPAGIELPPPLCSAPPRIQRGAFLQMFGKFDGDLTNTVVTIGGKVATILVESPRSCVVLAPPLSSGSVSILIHDDGGGDECVLSGRVGKAAPVRTIGVVGLIVGAAVAVWLAAR